MADAWLYRQDELRAHIMRSRKAHGSNRFSCLRSTVSRATVPTEYRDEATDTDQSSRGKVQRTDRTAGACLRCNRSDSSLRCSIISESLVIKEFLRSIHTSRLLGTNPASTSALAEITSIGMPPNLMNSSTIDSAVREGRNRQALRRRAPMVGQLEGMPA